MKILTSELIGLALNWAVAKADGRRIKYSLGGGLEVRGHTEDGKELPEHWDLWMYWYPSTNWAQGGPIIDRSNITVGCGCANIGDGDYYYGKTNLIAAMRCYVASKLGNEIDIPKELL